jgi:hypothetical protein
MPSTPNRIDDAGWLNLQRLRDFDEFDYIKSSLAAFELADIRLRATQLLCQFDLREMYVMASADQGAA